MLLSLLLLVGPQAAPVPAASVPAANGRVNCTLRVVTVDPRQVDPGILSPNNPPPRVRLNGIVRDDLSPCSAAETTIAGADAEVSADPFDDRLREAERNEQAARGGAFEAAFLKEVGAAYSPRLNECARQAGGLATEPIDVLLKLGAGGAVEDALVRPQTPFGRCFLELSRKAGYPRPPSAGYWTAIRVRFNAAQ
jgi:hypothetical protein